MARNMLCLCFIFFTFYAGYFYVYLTQARVLKEEVASVEEMSPYDPTLGYFFN